MDKISKIVLVIQDLKTKEGKDIAVISGDVHFKHDKKDLVSSFMLPLDQNRDLQRHIKALASEAMSLKVKAINKKPKKK
jgi:hypothetical protein